MCDMHLYSYIMYMYRYVKFHQGTCVGRYILFIDMFYFTR